MRTVLATFLLCILWISLPAYGEAHGDPNRAGVVWTPFDNRSDFIKARQIIDEIAPSGKDTVFNIPKDRYFSIPKGSWFYPKPVTGWRPSLTDWTRQAVVGHNPPTEEASEFGKALDRALEKIVDQPHPELFLLIDSHGEFGELCLPDEKAVDLHHLIDVLAKRVESHFPGRKKENLVVNIFYGACKSDSITWALVDEKWGKKRNPQDLPKINWITQSAEHENAHGESLWTDLRDYRCKDGGRFDTKDLKTHGPRYCVMDKEIFGKNDYRVQSNYQKIRSTVPAEELFKGYAWLIEKELHHLDETDIPFLQKTIRGERGLNKVFAWQALAMMKHSPDIIPFLKSQLEKGDMTAQQIGHLLQIAWAQYRKYPDEAKVLDEPILKVMSDLNSRPLLEQDNLAVGIRIFPHLAKTGHAKAIDELLEKILEGSKPHITDVGDLESPVRRAAEAFLEIHGKEAWEAMLNKASTHSEKDYYAKGRSLSLLLVLASHEPDSQRDLDLGKRLLGGLKEDDIKSMIETLRYHESQEHSDRRVAADALRVVLASYPKFKTYKKTDSNLGLNR